MAGGEAPRVFISYSHDSDEHRQRVWDLAERLRRSGVDCRIDRYERSPAQGWVRWMDEQIRTARYVLIVCTETYLRRAEGREVPGVGLGVVWESGIITSAIYRAAGRNEKFIPVYFAPEDRRFVPPYLEVTRYELTSDAAYRDLWSHLTDQPHVAIPPLIRSAARRPEEGEIP